MGKCTTESEIWEWWMRRKRDNECKQRRKRDSTRISNGKRTAAATTNDLSIVVNAKKRERDRRSSVKYKATRIRHEWVSECVYSHTLVLYWHKSTITLITLHYTFISIVFILNLIHIPIPIQFSLSKQPKRCCGERERARAHRMRHNNIVTFFEQKKNV